MALLVFVYSFFDPHLKSLSLLWIFIGVYLLINFALRLVFSTYLYLIRLRMIFALIDVVFISLVILNSSGPANSWFLFYLFPILSVSRYLGVRGILALTACAVAAYSVVYWLAPELGMDPHSFVMRCVVLLGVAGAAGNVAKSRHRELFKLSQIHEDIGARILARSKFDAILELILLKGLEFTRSVAGHIRLFNEQTGEYEIIAAIGDSENENWSSSKLANNYAAQAVKTGEEVLITQIPENRNGFFGYILQQAKPQSALFVPLGSSRGVLAVIAVYSNWTGHYGKIDIKRLRAFAPLVESADRLRKVSEAELYYRELIEGAPDPIIVLDKDGKIVVFNEACRELWGYTEQEVAEKPDVEHYYESREYAIEIFKMLWKSPGHRRKNFEAQIKAKNGEIIPISLSACLVEKEKNVVDRSIGVFKDRRQEIEWRERVLQKERLAAVGDLAGKRGHDIKHHISIALNYLELLQTQCDPEQEPERYDNYTAISEALRDSVEEFDKLLKANQPPLPEKWPVQIGSLFRKTERRCRLQALDSHTKFVVTYPDPDIKLFVDQEQMESVLMNLFTNSIHAIKRKQKTDPSFQGRIELYTSLNGNEVELVLKDNGCGVAPEDEPHIFNAFVTTKGTQGTGLGLFIVRSIIQQHRGRIEFESGIGEGATFHIFLPLATQESQTTES